MAVPGRDPQAKKHGRTPLTTEWHDVPDEPYDGPKVNLPKKLLGDTPLPQVKAWWEVVSAMPHCRLWGPGDWLFALDTAVLKQEFYAGAAPVSLVVEIRHREDQLGTTVEARRKLRIRYVKGEQQRVEPDQAQVSRLEDRRSRLSNAS